MKGLDKGRKPLIISSMNDTCLSKALGIGLRFEEFVDKSLIRGGSTNEVMSRGFFLSNVKHRWSRATSMRLVKNAIQEILGHKSSKTTEIYTPVSARNLGAIKSPLDTIFSEKGINLAKSGDKWAIRWSQPEVCICDIVAYTPKNRKISDNVGYEQVVRHFARREVKNDMGKPI